ncbi:MAG: hypothetical protein RL456_2339 [Pseudomonadota bacterium]|jgi:hypothetical protein
MTTTAPSLSRLLSVGEVATLTGVAASTLRVWERRYGWPTPHRSRGGERRYTPAQVDAIREVARRAAAGMSLRDMIVDGLPRIPPARPAPPLIPLDLSDIPEPLRPESLALRRSLIYGLVQRHPGRVRDSLAQLARIHPADRGPAALLVVAAYRAQIPDHAWLDAILED